MDRRQVLSLMVKGGLPAGLLAGAGGWAGYTFLPPRRSARLQPVDQLAARLHETLSPEQRARTCVEYDHPLRQYHNRGVSGGGMAIDGLTFSREQRSLVTDLLHAGLSETGRERLPRQFFMSWPGVQVLKLLICGEPGSGDYQVVLTGPHLNLRLGGRSREGVAFGGPQVYGDQRGDGRPGLPGNVYRYQLQAATDLFRGLDPELRREALLPEAPVQTRIEVRGSRGRFPGVPVAGLPHGSRQQAHRLVDAILSTYGHDDVRYARRCLEANGGIDALFLSYYEDGEVGGSGEYQIVRLEGPAAVLYFRGAPHVHAFINIAMDGDSPLSVGEVIGTNPTVLESEGVQLLFERVMRGRGGTDLAFYPLESAVGRLRAGAIRSGDIYTLESWRDTFATTSIRGGAVSGPLRARLQAQRITLEPERVYTLAATGHVTRGDLAGEIGATGPWRSQGPLRDAAVAWLKQNGFSRL